jgi:hypothetical protein
MLFGTICEDDMLLFFLDLLKFSYTGPAIEIPAKEWIKLFAPGVLIV